MMAKSFEITKDLLEKLQKVELEMLIEFDRICRKNNIKYSIMCGTLLGAVRNGGFIPWDDDCDVVFKRDEYEKFFEICKKDLFIFDNIPDGTMERILNKFELYVIRNALNSKIFNILHIVGLKGCFTECWI